MTLPTSQGTNASVEATRSLWMHHAEPIGRSRLKGHRRCDNPTLCRAKRSKPSGERRQATILPLRSSKIPSLRRDSSFNGVGLKAPTLSGDKIMRLRSQTAKIEGGFVVLPKEASWLDVYLHELLSFPNSKHADQVDSTVYALAWITENPRWTGWTEESLKGLESLTNSLFWQSQFWALAR